MTTVNTTGYLTLPAAAALAANVRVKINTSGQFALAAATDAAVGVTEHATSAAGDNVTVKLWTAPGTFFMTASGAITQGAQVFPAASGKIAGTGTTAINFAATQAAAADGDIIECAPCAKGA